MEPDNVWLQRVTLRLRCDCRRRQGDSRWGQAGIRLLRYSSTAAVPLARMAARGVRKGFPSSSRDLGTQTVPVTQPHLRPVQPHRRQSAGLMTLLMPPVLLTELSFLLPYVH